MLDKDYTRYEYFCSAMACDIGTDSHDVIHMLSEAGADSSFHERFNEATKDFTEADLDILSGQEEESVVKRMEFRLPQPFRNEFRAIMKRIF